MQRWHLTASLTLLCASFTVQAETGKYKDIVDKMKTLAATYSGFSSVYSVGKNDDGVEVMAMRISTNPAQMDNSKIGHLVVSTHHGNEIHAPLFTLAFIERLLKQYSGQALYRTNLADMEWTIIPVVNISGYNSNNRYEKGQDPNRDYPGPCISATGGKLKSIQLMMDVAGRRLYTGSLTVHGYLGAITYPWGVDVSNTHSKDHNLFEQITSKAAAVNGYRYGTSTDIVYPCDGSFEDWAYWKKGMWSLLLELEDGSAEDIRKNVSAMQLYFTELASSPSTQNQLTSSCQRSGRPDLHIE